MFLLSSSVEFFFFFLFFFSLFCNSYIYIDATEIQENALTPLNNSFITTNELLSVNPEISENSIIMSTLPNLILAKPLPSVQQRLPTYRLRHPVQNSSAMENKSFLITARNESFLTSMHTQSILSVFPNQSYPADTSNPSHPENLSNQLHPADFDNQSYPTVIRNQLDPADPHNKSYPKNLHNQLHPEDPYNQLDSENLHNQLHPEDPHNKSYPENFPNQLHPQNSDSQSYPENLPNQLHPADSDNQSYPTMIRNKSTVHVSKVDFVHTPFSETRAPSFNTTFSSLQSNISESSNLSSFIRKLCLKKCETLSQNITTKNEVLIFIIADADMKNQFSKNVYDDPMEINEAQCYCEKLVKQMYTPKNSGPSILSDTTIASLNLTYEVFKEKQREIIKDEDPQFLQGKQYNVSESYDAALAENSKKINELSIKNSELDKTRILAQPAFKSIGKGISEMDCNTLCMLDQECVSYRWSSFENQCEFQQTFSLKCSEKRNGVFGEDDCEWDDNHLDRKGKNDEMNRLNPVQLSRQAENKMEIGQAFSTVNPSETLNELYQSSQNLHQETLSKNNTERLSSNNAIHITSTDFISHSNQENERVHTTLQSPETEENGQSLGTEEINHPKRNENYNGIAFSKNSLLQKTILGSAVSHLIPGLLPSSTESLLRGPEEIPTLLHGAANAVKTVQSVLAAGDTVMKTFPVADMVRAGQQLARNGLLKFGKVGAIKGGVPPGVKDKAKGATRPPRGVEAPYVYCYPQGMRCCIPQGAAAKYQKNPPLLNGIATPECTAHYISNINKLCVTIMYEDNQCNQAVIVTETSIVYRNVMMIPEKSMNNAICECIIPKSKNHHANESSSSDSERNYMIPASARWQYSQNAKEKEKEAKQRFHETVKKLGNAAKTAFFLSDIVTKPYADPQAASVSEGAASFLHSITELGEDLHE